MDIGQQNTQLCQIALCHCEVVTAINSPSTTNKVPSLVAFARPKLITVEDPWVVFHQGV